MQLAPSNVDGHHHAAPRCSRQSVNPPVDAPASRARRPVTSMSKRSSAASSLVPPPADKTGGASRDHQRLGRRPGGPACRPRRRRPATRPAAMAAWACSGWRPGPGAPARRRAAPTGQRGIAPVRILRPRWRSNPGCCRYDGGAEDPPPPPLLADPAVDDDDGSALAGVAGVAACWAGARFARALRGAGGLAGTSAFAPESIAAAASSRPAAGFLDRAGSLGRAGLSWPGRRSLAGAGSLAGAAFLARGRLRGGGYVGRRLFTSGWRFRARAGVGGRFLGCACFLGRRRLVGCLVGRRGLGNPA